MTVFGVRTSPLAPAPARFQSSGLNEISGRTFATTGLGVGAPALETIAVLIARGRISNWPPLRMWRMRLLCAKASAISRDGACRFECTLLARMMALNDSKASVANKIAGPNRRICSVRYIRR
jgi:hypothetical protein